MRPLAWYDLPLLVHCRQQALVLDSAFNLTRGDPLGVAAALAYLSPGRTTFTGIVPAQSDQPMLIGQMTHRADERAARLLYLTPAAACEAAAVSELIDGLVCVAGQWGVFHLLAEINENASVLETLRQAGFSVYVWQRIWRLVPCTEHTPRMALWSPARPDDEVAIRNLCHLLIPPLAQRMDQLPSPHSRGLVYRHKRDVLAYLEITRGPRGIYLQPLFHPEVEDVVDDLLTCLPELLNAVTQRPVYLVERSYQAWLEAALLNCNALPSERQALLARYLTNVQRVSQPVRRSRLESISKIDPVVPIAHHYQPPAPHQEKPV